MAALDLSPVLALANKALQLMYVDGHYGRAATKFAAAVEAARALGPAAGEDCLVVTTLQVDQVHALVLHSFTRSLPIADVAAVDVFPIMGNEILAAWRALQRSGALEERRLLTEGAPHAAHNNAKTAAAAAAASAPERLRACALGSCGVRETYPAQHKLCGACAAVVYCCREHLQLADWPAHKAACKAACNAARAAKDAAKQR